MIYQGNSLDILKTLPAESVDCCVTSPPYYGLRDYGTGQWIGGDPNCPHRRLSKCSDKTITGHAQAELKGNVGDAIYKTVCPLCGAVRVDEQIGLEETPYIYIYILTQLFREVRRVLKPQGTLWLNIGDSYAGGAGRWGGAENISDIQSGNQGSLTEIPVAKKWKDDTIKQKDLIGIPWMLAFALRADGWYLRQDIIWAKTNCMPESVKDRCVKSHEYIFLLSKSPKYYFDYKAIQTPSSEVLKKRAEYGLKTSRPEDMDGHFDTEKMGDRFVKDMANARDVWDEEHYKNLQYKGQQNHSMHERRAEGFKDVEYTMANKRDVWRVSCSSYKEAHFATFPEELIRPCIKAGCPKGGVVLDPFFGSGTTGAVAIQEGCDYIGIELNPEYIELANRRLSEQQIRMF